MGRHLNHEANKACLDHYSKSTVKRDMEWVRLANIGSDQEDPDDLNLAAMEAAANSGDFKCQQCGRNYKTSNVKRNMVSHLSHEANKACLDHYSKSTLKRERDWVRLAS